MNGDSEITFSAWTPWSDRPRLKRGDGPWLGLDLWGRFERAPGEAERPYPMLPREVIYVGETKHLDLRPLTGEHHRLAHGDDDLALADAGLEEWAAHASLGRSSAMGIGGTGALLTLVPWLPAIVGGLALCATGVFIAQATSSSYIGAVTTQDRALAEGV